MTVIREGSVLQGLDPDFRIAWEEMLTSEERKEIKRAVRKYSAPPRLRVGGLVRVLGDDCDFLAHTRSDFLCEVEAEH